MMTAASPGKVSRRKASPQQGQPNFGNQQNYNNNQQPPYPPREQSQPYGGQQPNSNYQGRPQHQPQQNQPYSPPPQPYQPPQPQPVAAAPAMSSGCRRSSPARSRNRTPQNGAPNGYDNQGGDRFPRHRRRRHRGPAARAVRGRICRTCRRISAATTVPKRATADTVSNLKCERARQSPGPFVYWDCRAAPPGDGASTGSSAGTRRRFSRLAGIAR